jgi:RNA polymerase sigma-70 factor (ECF subfamily)
MLLLEPDERLILSLSYADGLSQTEVAQLMNIPLGTVKTHALRAKEKLRSSLTAYQTRSV